MDLVCLYSCFNLKLKATGDRLFDELSSCFQLFGSMDCSVDEESLKLEGSSGNDRSLDQ